MNQDQIRGWFDKAFTKMREGDIAGAVACFQTVVDQSENIYAIQIARRDLDWCFPLLPIVERLHVAAHPIALDTLINQAVQPMGSNALDFKTYSEELVQRLEQVQSVCRLNDTFWVSKSQLHTEISRAVDKILNPQQPQSLLALVSCLFADCGSLRLTLQLSNAVRAGLQQLHDVVLIENDCIFNSGTLCNFGAEFVKLIESRREPQSLRNAVALTHWPVSVIQNIQTEALGRSLSTYAEAELVEIAPDLWFLDRLSDFSTIRVTAAFTDPFGTLKAEDIVRRCLLPLDARIRLRPDFVHHQFDRIKRNPSLFRIGQDLWLLKQSIDALNEEMSTRLAEIDHPVTAENLLDKIVETRPSIVAYRKELYSALIEHLNHNPNVLLVSEMTWMHRQAIPMLLDRVYEELQSRQLTTKQLLSEYIGAVDDPAGIKPEFIRTFHYALGADDRFMLNADGQWRIIPPGNRVNNSAYAVLYNDHRPLNLRELTDRVKEYRGRISHFELTGDPRFRQSTDGRWMLSEWILINDLSAEYLSKVKSSQTRTTIVEQVCVNLSIPVAQAIFEPERDPRFVRDPFGRWICRSAGSVVTAEMLDHLVQVATDGMWGIPLEQLTHDAFHRIPADFFDIENTMLQDGRLIVCDGLWYPRECLYRVTAEDVQRIVDYLAQKGYPISAVELAQACLDRPLGLTDVSEVLSRNSDFINVGGSGWLLRKDQSAAVGRERRINYPIHSGKYIPAFNPELLVEVDDNAERDQRTPERPRQVSQTSSRPQQVRITLTFEDVRDGSLVVVSNLRSFLDNALEQPAFTFVGASYESILCWYDAQNNLIHGLKDWFHKEQLTYGDEIRLALSHPTGQFSIEKTGERDEQVHREGMRRSQVEDLREEAVKANRSYHDLTIEILDHFKTPLHLDDLWRMVDYRRSARKSTISAILSTYSYFVSSGKGYWRFDEKEYAKMIMELQRQVKQLSRDNEELRNQLGNHLLYKTEATSFRGENDSLRHDLELVKETLRQALEAKSNVESELRGTAATVDQLHTDIQSQVVELQSLGNNYAAQIDTIKSLEIQLQSTMVELDQLRGSLVMAEDENRSLHTELDEQATQARILSDCIATLQRKYDLLETISQAQIDEYHKKAEFENKQLTAKCEHAWVAIHGFEQTITSLRVELESKSERLTNLELLHQRTVQEFDELKRHCTLISVSDTEHATRIQELEEQLDKTSKELAQSREQETQLANEVVGLSDQLRATEASREELRSQTGELDHALGAREAEFRELSDKVQSMEGELTTQRRERDILTRSLERLSAEHETLRKAHSQSERVRNSLPGRFAQWWMGRQIVKTSP